MNLAAGPAVITLKAAKPRWRPRFFLRTLLLFVLTLASAATLWWNWGPWHLAYVIEEDAPIIAAGFSPDGKYVYTIAELNANANASLLDELGKMGVNVTLRDARSGAVRFRQHVGGHNEIVRFSPAGDLLMLQHGGIPCGDSVTGIWKLPSGEAIKLPNGMIDGYISFSAANDYAAGRADLDVAGTLVTLPDWKVVKKVDHFLGFARTQAAFLETDIKRTTVETEPKSTVHLISLPKMETLQSWDVDGFVQAACLSPDDRFIAINIQAEPQDKLIVFDVATRREIAATTGRISRGPYDPFSRDGITLATWNGHDQHTTLWDFQANTSTVSAPPPAGTVTSTRSTTGQTRSIAGSQGKPLIDLNDVRWRHRVAFPIRSAQFDSAETRCLCYASPAMYERLTLEPRAAVFCRSASDSGLGLTGRPEFLMTILLGGALIWSVLRR